MQTSLSSTIRYLSLHVALHEVCMCMWLAKKMRIGAGREVQPVTVNTKPSQHSVVLHQWLDCMRSAVDRYPADMHLRVSDIIFCRRQTKTDNAAHAAHPMVPPSQKKKKKIERRYQKGIAPTTVKKTPPPKGQQPPEPGIE